MTPPRASVIATTIAVFEKEHYDDDLRHLWNCWNRIAVRFNIGVRYRKGLGSTDTFYTSEDC